mgnify:CR=1 FL=1
MSEKLKNPQEPVSATGIKAGPQIAEIKTGEYMVHVHILKTSLI